MLARRALQMQRNARMLPPKVPLCPALWRCYLLLAVCKAGAEECACAVTETNLKKRGLFSKDCALPAVGQHAGSLLLCGAASMLYAYWHTCTYCKA